MPNSVTTYLTSPPRHRHGAAFGQMGNDSGDRAVPGGGGDHDHRSAAFGQGRAADEIQAPAQAAPENVPLGLGTDLARQVHFQGAADGDHALVLGDDQGIVHIFGRMEGEAGVVVHIFIQGLAADAETADDFSPVQRFPFAGYHTVLHQGHDRIGHDFGVDAQVPAMGEKPGDPIGQVSESHVDRIPVPYEAGRVLRNFFLRRRQVGVREFGEGRIVVDEIVDLADMDEGIPLSAGHVPVDLGDDDPGGFGGGPHDVHGYAQADEPVGVRRGYLDQGHVDGHQPAPEQAGDFEHEHRRVIRAGLVDGVAGVGSHVKGIVTKPGVEPLVRVRGLAQVQVVEDLDIL